MKNTMRSDMVSSGIALLAVLAVLTVLAILAAAFVVFMSINRNVGEISIAKVQSDMLVNSAVEHALSLLSNDVEEQPAWDDTNEDWHRYFSPGSVPDRETIDVDGVRDKGSPPEKGDARWIYVKNGAGAVVGRYAVLVEDEGAKINVNAATALSPDMQNHGVGTFEIMLTDGKTAGLPISKSLALRLLNYRYGFDNQPGQASRDDNLTESLYALDKIDNNADGIIDEAGEGIDEQDEYTPARPNWDDRAFSSINEMCDQFSDQRLTPAARRILRKYATVYSASRESFWDPVEKIWQKKVDLNVADRYQVHKVLRRANKEIPFEPSSRNLRALAVNLLDYRDENHVLSTMGSEYGVESVCFNEIMANEASMVFQTDWDASYVAAWNPDLHTPTRKFYYANELDFPDEFFKVTSFNGSGNSYSLTLKEPKRGGLSNFLDYEPFYDMDLPWEPNFWKDCDAEIRIENGSTYTFTVTSSAEGNSRQVTLKPKSAFNISNVTGSLDRAYCRLLSRWSKSWECAAPEAHMKWWFPTGRQSKHNEYYYRAYFVNTTLKSGAPGGPTGNTKSLVTEFDVDGDTAVYNPTQMNKLKYIYNEGKAMRANEYGYIPIVGTSSRKCAGATRGFPYENAINFILFTRPDIVELINVSDKPISLRNWQVVMNTGVEALTLDTIDMAKHYSVERNGTYEDPNPVIKPGGYFYLANNSEIFDIHYANGDGEYGSSVEEDIPLFELAEKDWGITYPIIEVTPPYSIKVDGADWEKNIMRNELMMIISDRKSEKENVPDGLFLTIWSNNRNTLNKWSGFQVHHLGVEPGDRVMIFGLPRKGGFVSFTLKNEYGQITARTTTYGTVEEDERGYSTEKADPTHYNWVKVKTPSIGGTERKARNRGTYMPDYARPHIKNNRFTSVGEIQNVRRADDWENLGMSKGQKTIAALKALSKYFTVSGIRLDAEEEGAHISGWKPAFGMARNSNRNTIEVDGTEWEPGIWTGQKLTVLTGSQRGEEFVVTNSSRNTLTVAGYSTAKREPLKIQKGEKFSVGPGYSTSMYYTRRSGEPGIWEWENKNLEPMPYALYLFGLNDSIKTTEFLEENWNADLDIEIYNFTTREFDLLPLKDLSGTRDSLASVLSSSRMQYNKADGLYCGMIKPEHISSKGGIRLKLTPHNLENQDCSGFAWFDCVYMAPVGMEGKININTASERVLGALKNITPKLAHNIAQGMDPVGRPDLKPYKQESDLLDVAGITPDIFKDICNLVTTRSDQFRVAAIAQSLTDVNQDGVFNSTQGDKILSESYEEVVVDRSQLTDGNPETRAIRVLK